MRHASLSWALPWVVLTSCGGNVVVDSASGTTTGAGGSTAGGTGGAATSGVSAGGASSSSAGLGGAVIGTTSVTVGAGGASVTCNEGDIGLDVGGVDIQLPSGCNGVLNGLSMAPTGVELLIPGGVELGLAGCASSSGDPSVRLGIGNATVPGTYTQGEVSYTDGDGGVWMGLATGFQATIDELGPVGGQIVGSFQATIAQGGVDQPIQGKFSVCRLPDVVAP